MDASEISPSIARMLLQEDVSVTITTERRKTKWSVVIGPFFVAEGSDRRRQKALDAIADVVIRTKTWLVSVAGQKDDA